MQPKKKDIFPQTNKVAAVNYTNYEVKRNFGASACLSTLSQDEFRRL
jgi:hypothetical protein